MPVATWLSQQTEKEAGAASVILSASSWNLFKTVLSLLIRHHLHRPQNQTAKENEATLSILFDRTSHHSFSLLTCALHWNLTPGIFG